MTRELIENLPLEQSFIRLVLRTVLTNQINPLKCVNAILTA